jgi:Fur family transcriptional regulator, ferric uptake regulator
MARLRRTKQRDTILAEIRAAGGPLSVAEIHERASREVPRLGIATVYRAIRALREEGKVAVVELPGEEPRYEPVGRGHHHHFRCRSCGQTFDLGVCPLGVPAGTTLPGGYRVEDHHITLYGRCADCVA